MIDSITHHPYMIYGEHGYCTELMKVMNGSVIGKRGAGGVYMSGIVGRSVGCAVKIDDGNMNPQYCVTQAFLQWYQQTRSFCYCQHHSVNTLENDVKDTSIDTISSCNTANQNKVCDECNDKLLFLKKYLEMPLLNSMSIQIGFMKCPDALFKMSNHNES